MSLPVICKNMCVEACKKRVEYEEMINGKASTDVDICVRICTSVSIC